MRRGIGSTPTRLNLLRSRRRLERVRDGADLLRRKREALVRELLAHAGPAIDARDRIADESSAAYAALLDALAHDGRAGVRLSAEPLPPVSVEMETSKLWGLTLGDVKSPPAFERTLEGRGTAPGPTSPATVEAARHFERLARILLEAAPREMLLRRLGHAVARTSRQVRALEHRVQPTLEADIARTSTLLDEREREDHLRLRRFLRQREARTTTGRAAGASSGPDGSA